MSNLNRILLLNRNIKSKLALIKFKYIREIVIQKTLRKRVKSETFIIF